MLKSRIVISAYQTVSDLIEEFLDDAGDNQIHPVEVDGLRRIQAHMEKRAGRKCQFEHDPNAPRIPIPLGKQDRLKQKEEKRKRWLENQEAQKRNQCSKPVYQARKQAKGKPFVRAVSSPLPNHKGLSPYARDAFIRAQEARGKLAPEKPLEGAWSDPNSPPW
jgi:hypothetical protein